MPTLDHVIGFRSMKEYRRVISKMIVKKLEIKIVRLVDMMG